MPLETHSKTATAINKLFFRILSPSCSNPWAIRGRGQGLSGDAAAVRSFTIKKPTAATATKRLTIWDVDKPVRLTIELPGPVHRDLDAYAAALARQSGQAQDTARLIAPMLARFMAADRAFVRGRGKAE